MRKILNVIFLSILLAIPSYAAVSRVEVIERAPLAGFPGYERIVGKIHFAVDPKLAANHIIVDLDLAPRDAHGMVEFTSDLLMMKPIDPSRSNGTAIIEVPNRGNRLLLRMFDLANAPDPQKPEDVGDPLLFQLGFTMVWVGWEWDVPRRPGMMALDSPTIPGLTGVVRSEIIRNDSTKFGTLGDRAQSPYPAADAADALMTWRDDPTGPATMVPRDQWKILPDGNTVQFDPGFVPGRIYDVIYKAKDAKVCGLGPAAIRDYISYLKKTGAVKHAIAFGVSQSGRFVRDFVYRGFNSDEDGVQVFDGMWVHVGGAGRGSFDIRFGQASRDGHPRTNRFYPTDLFPFTDFPQTDSGMTDSLLGRAMGQHVTPKMFYTNGAYEYWGRAASLIHISIDGQRDFDPAPTSRVYFLAGTQHVPAAKPVPHDTQSPANPQDYRWVLRALLLAMNDWITKGTPPPDSRYPLIARQELCTRADLRFPAIPGVHPPKDVYTVYRLDFGPDFRSQGIITLEPPLLGAAFPALVPQVDQDGNETSGVRVPELSVPLATYTGWNLRDPKIGAPDVTFDMVGSYLTFPRTRAERESRSDPRLSIEERYKSRDAYLRKISVAADQLVESRLLLRTDVPKVVHRAGERWDSLMNSAIPATAKAEAR